MHVGDNLIHLGDGEGSLGRRADVAQRGQVPEHGHGGTVGRRRKFGQLCGVLCEPVGLLGAFDVQRYGALIGLGTFSSA
jgi:hypothetical protein